MDSILIILKKKKWPKGFICPYTGTIFYIILIYSRCQVSVYRTIGPLVVFFFFFFFEGGGGYVTSARLDSNQSQ